MESRHSKVEAAALKLIPTSSNHAVEYEPTLKEIRERIPVKIRRMYNKDGVK